MNEIIENISKKQYEVYNELPDTRENIAEELDITSRAVRYRMNAMESEGLRFSSNSEGVWHVCGGLNEKRGANNVEGKKTHEKAYSVNERNGQNDGGASQEKDIGDEIKEENKDQQREYDRDTELKRTNTYEKAQATKEINNALVEIEKDYKEALEDKPLHYTDFDRSGGNSTLVIPRTDDHFGARITKRGVNEEYTTPIAKERVNYIIDHAIEKAKERGDVEEVVLGLFGDHVEGENIFPNHKAEIEKFVREQIKIASSTYINQIQKLADEFEHVKIVTVPGNHGSLGKGSISNADDIVFDQIDMGIDLLDIDNVTMEYSNGSYINFDIRSHSAYARHGQDALKHASTSSGDDRWLNWKEDSEFSISYHGHHHEVRIEPVGHGQVLQCGTPVPPSLFVDSIGSTGIPRVLYHFTTDDNLVEDMQIIDF